MPGKSNSFRQVAPFFPRMGVMGNVYVAFGSDRISAPGATPFGCLSINPRSDLISTGDEGGPFAPNEIIYTIKNVGGASLDWSISISETWAEVSMSSGTLAAGHSVDVIVSLNSGADDLPSNTEPYIATISFVNETNDCGSTQLSVALTVTGVVFEQFDGPFVFPNKAFFGNGEFFSIQDIGGENRVFFDCLYHPMSSDHENGNIPVIQTDVGYPKGVMKSSWSGNIIYDINTDSYVGVATASIEESGVLPGGQSFTIAGPTRTVTNTNFDTLLNDLETGAEGRFFFLSKKYSEGPTQDGTFLRKFYSPPPIVNGCLPTGVMGQIWVDGYELDVEYSQPITVEDLGFPVARTGTDARTQEVLSYDPDTKTYTGTKSRAKINVDIPAGKTMVTGEFKFLVTPNDASPPYFKYISKEYTVTPSTTYQAIIEFPWVVDATVYYFSGNFSFNPSIYQGFFVDDVGSFGVETSVISANAAWPKNILFGTPPPNSGFRDDYDEYSGSDGDVGILDTGYGWVAEYQFITQDRVDFYDDFEFYVDGDITILGGGIGWVSPGIVFVIQIIDVYDDFESYPTGTITSLDFPLEFWVADGEFTS